MVSFDDFFAPKTVLGIILGSGFLFQHPNLKKRDLILSLLRETRPEKIGKMLQDLSKMNMPIRRMITKWHGFEATKIANLLAGNNDANHVYVLMAKLQQMIGMGR